MKTPPTVFLAHLALGLIWIYQGLVPKILFPETGETEMLKQSGIFSGKEHTIVMIIGWMEIIFGIIVLLVHRKIMHLLNILALVILTAGALMSDAKVFSHPFNPFSLNLSMIFISLIAILNLNALPNKTGGETHP